MHNGIIYLKVKIKSLAEEARIIRREEAKAKARRDTPLLIGLRLHRLEVVRREARASQIAYAFLRGVPMAKVEPTTTRRYDHIVAVEKAKSIAQRFGNKFDEAAFKEWVKGAQVPLPVAG